MCNEQRCERCRWIARGSWVGVCCAVWVACLLSTPALGASRDSRERTARKACLAGDWVKGIAILSQLFVETDDATYIYNQGRCLEQNARYPEAVAHFQEYLLVGKNLSPADKTEAEKHVRSCQAMHARQSGQPEVSAPAESAVVVAPPRTALPVPAVGPVLEPASGGHALTSVPETSGSTGAGLRTVGGVTAAVGGAALLAGIMLNLKVNSMADDFSTLDGYTDTKESDRKTYETLGWVGYGVGAACIATGAVLYVLGHRVGKQRSSSLALTPAFTEGGATVILKGGY